MDIGTYVIVRSSPSGVWAGTLAAVEGDKVELTDARRLWRWWAAKGVSLSGVAVYGLHPLKKSECKIEPPVSLVTIFQVCEILSVSGEARTSIEAAETVPA